MSARVVRAVALGTFFLFGIPGMIISSINDNTGAGVTCGIIGAIAAIVLLAVTAATTGRIPPTAVSAPGTDPRRAGAPAAGEAEAEALEDKVATLVAAGADETQVRALVGDAVRLGRTLTGTTRG